MQNVTERAYILGIGITAVSIIYLAWGMEAPIHNFALVFGGCLLGHVLTIVLDDTTDTGEDK